MRKCVWCLFKQLFTSLVFRPCKKGSNILKGFCPLKAEIVQFSIGFRLKESRRMRETMPANEITCQKRFHLCFNFFPFSFTASWLVLYTLCLVLIIETY